MPTPKTDMESRICRCAIEWERAHAETRSNDTAQAADRELREAVNRYREYVISVALPISGASEGGDDGSTT